LYQGDENSTLATNVSEIIFLKNHKNPEFEKIQNLGFQKKFLSSNFFFGSPDFFLV